MEADDRIVPGEPGVGSREAGDAGLAPARRAPGQEPLESGPRIPIAGGLMMEVRAAVRTHPYGLNEERSDIDPEKIGWAGHIDEEGVHHKGPSLAFRGK
jgi:hypothetical protein